MARNTKFRVEGLRELEKTLKELPKATGKRVLREALKDAGAPIEVAAERLAPIASGDLQKSHMTGTKLSKRQQGIHRRWAGTSAVRTPKGWRSSPAKAVYVFVGPGPLPQAHLQEFGSADQAPQPFMRPAWNAEKMNALAILVQRLAERIEVARARFAKKAERLARSMTK
jgi:HK97 gp10 family phage protein